jgi:hypothetical protein
MAWTDTLKRITGAKSAAEKAVQQVQEELPTQVRQLLSQ